MTHKLAILAITVITALCGGAAAYASSGGYTIYPTYEHDGNRNWIIRRASPGEEIRESLTLENLTGETRRISLLVNEAGEDNGGFIVSPSETHENVGGWIKTEEQSYLLGPYQKITIPVNIEIPSDAKEQKYRAAVFATAASTAENGINIVTKIGVRVYLEVTSAPVAQTDIFNAAANKNSIFFFLSMAGILSSCLYWLINRIESNKHAKQQA